MRMFIPELGMRIRLTKDWTFDLHYERRNESLFPLVDPKHGFPTEFAWRVKQEVDPVPFTIPKGTVLTVDRIYIRSGNHEFSSLSFRINRTKGKAKQQVDNPFGVGLRFWAKLDDVNQIEFTVEKDDQPWWYGVADALEAGKSVTVAPRVGYLGKTVKAGADLTIKPFTPTCRADVPQDEDVILIVKEGTKVAFLRTPKDTHFGDPKITLYDHDARTGRMVRVESQPVNDDGKMIYGRRNSAEPGKRRYGGDNWTDNVWPESIVGIARIPTP